MASTQIKKPQINTVVIIAHPLAEDCKNCGQGIAVTTEGLCPYCDLVECGLIEKPTSHQ